MNFYMLFVISMVPKLPSTKAAMVLQLSRLLYKNTSVISILMKQLF